MSSFQPIVFRTHKGTYWATQFSFCFHCIVFRCPRLPPGILRGKSTFVCKSLWTLWFRFLPVPFLDQGLRPWWNSRALGGIRAMWAFAGSFRYTSQVLLRGRYRASRIFGTLLTRAGKGTARSTWWIYWARKLAATLFLPTWSRKLTS